MNQQSFRPIVLARFLLCLPFFIMLLLMLIEASLHAATTFLVIEAGRDVARGTFRLADLMWILAAESIAYIVGALSWIFAERTGFLAYARYMRPRPISSSRRGATWRRANSCWPICCGSWRPNRRPI